MNDNDAPWLGGFSKRQMEAMTGLPLVAPEPPFCDTHGCRGRWWADQPHTLCDKAQRCQDCGQFMTVPDDSGLCNPCFDEAFADGG